jgi:hypothetical protein
VVVNATHLAKGGRPASRRPALLAALVVLGAFVLGGCGGSSVSDAVPKSTPDITPPTDTSIEKAAVQTTSTSTTATGTGTTGEPAKEGGTGETPKEGGEEAAKEGAASGAGGGTAAEKEKSTEASKGGSEAAGGGSPTGGASAP